MRTQRTKLARLIFNTISIKRTEFPGPEGESLKGALNAKNNDRKRREQQRLLFKSPHSTSSDEELNSNVSPIEEHWSRDQNRKALYEARVKQRGVCSDVRVPCRALLCHHVPGRAVWCCVCMSIYVCVCVVCLSLCLTVYVCLCCSIIHILKKSVLDFHSQYQVKQTRNTSLILIDYKSRVDQKEKLVRAEARKPMCVCVFCPCVRRVHGVCGVWWVWWVWWWW